MYIYIYMYVYIYIWENHRVCYIKGTISDLSAMDNKSHKVLSNRE